MRIGRRIVQTIVILCCFVGLVACQPFPPSGDRVYVSRVLSGQTLEIQGADSSPNRIRLIGIEAPDWRQTPWSMEATQRLEKLLGEEKTLFLESDVETQIRYPNGQTVRLAYAWKDGVLINEQLVEEGWALAVERSPNLKYNQRLLQAQEKARLLGSGIWNPENPMRQTPSEFRQQHPS